VDVDTIAVVTPSMTAFRLIVQREAIDVDLLARLVDTLVLPAPGVRRRGGSRLRPIGVGYGYRSDECLPRPPFDSYRRPSVRAGASRHHVRRGATSR
jgi:hypothetical protein